MKRFTTLCLVAAALIGLNAQDVEKGKISGEAFVDYYYNISRDSASSRIPNSVLKGAKDLNAFEYRRVTFSYDYSFSSTFQSRVRLESDQTSTNGNGVTPFIKDLSLKWKNIFDGSDLSFGVQPPPSFQVSESYWQFRCLEKTIMDHRSIASSRDLGIALKGKIDNEGILGYWIMIANGTSVKPETDKYKRAYAQINLAPMKNMNITLYTDYKARDKITQTNSANQSVVSLNSDVITSAAFIGVKGDEFSCGTEGFIQITRNGYSVSTGNQTNFSNLDGIGISVYGNYKILKDISLVGRYDYYDPNAKADHDSRNFAILGLSFLAEQNIRIIPNVLIETYEKGKNISYDPAITGRLTVHFVY